MFFENLGMTTHDDGAYRRKDVLERVEDGNVCRRVWKEGGMEHDT